jgi:hypothetical protein
MHELEGNTGLYLGANWEAIKGFAVKPMFGMKLGGEKIDYEFKAQAEYKIGFSI